MFHEQGCEDGPGGQLDVTDLAGKFFRLLALLHGNKHLFGPDSGGVANLVEFFHRQGREHAGVDG